MPGRGMGPGHCFSSHLPRVVPAEGEVRASGRREPVASDSDEVTCPLGACKSPAAVSDPETPSPYVILS